MPDAVAITWRQYRLERRMFWRNPSAAFFSIVLPLIFLALFGLFAAGDQSELDVLVPGIAGLSVMATTFSSLAMNLTMLREQGVLKRMRGTPLPSGSYLVAFGLNAVANAVIQLVVVVVAGKLLFGTGWPKDYVELVVYAVAGVLCLASLGVAWSHVIPNYDAAAALSNAVFLPVIAISGVFYDADRAPGFVQDIARALPLVHLVDGFSGALVTGRSLADNLSGLVVVLLWLALGTFLAVRGFSWEARRD